VAWGAGDRVREPDGVEGETERGLDARSEALGVAEEDDAGRVDLGLDERRGVEVGLGAELEGDAAVSRGLAVKDGLGADLDLGGKPVVERGREDGAVAESVDGGGVGRLGEAERGRVAGDLARADVAADLGTDEEATLGENDVGREGGALEEVDLGRRVQSGRLVDGAKDGTLGAAGRLVRAGGQDSREVELKPPGERAVELNRVAQDVRRVPDLQGGVMTVERVSRRGSLRR